jgi:3-phosphoshikimate 1-carboxyvinyltransferase
MNLLTIVPKSSLHGPVHHLPSSKSISNRALILNALSGNSGNLYNLSDANDTQLMQRLVFSTDETIDVEDAGTVMRFLTAYFAATNQAKTITGTARMKQRPIGILVEALRTLGAKIDYLEEAGYPPLKIANLKSQISNSLVVQGDVSSQFISALMMIAPTLPLGLTIELAGKIGSKPYIEMTASLMRKFGAIVSFEENLIRIQSSILSIDQFTIEGDWSSASYWFAFVALSKEAEILLPNMALRSLQGDRVIVDMMEILGVICEPRGDKLLLVKKDSHTTLEWDFSNCPDLAQTAAVVCAAKGITGIFTGLESLRIKETDRIAALQAELQKIGAQLIEQNEVWTLLPSIKLPDSIHVCTYHDHRMAMAFAPLATLMKVTIENPAVTRKSYPKFWEDMKGVGFNLTPTPLQRRGA